MVGQCCDSVLFFADNPSAITDVQFHLCLMVISNRLPAGIVWRDTSGGLNSAIYLYTQSFSTTTYGIAMVFHRWNDQMSQHVTSLPKFRHPNLRRTARLGPYTGAQVRTCSTHSEDWKKAAAPCPCGCGCHWTLVVDVCRCGHGSIFWVA